MPADAGPWPGLALRHARAALERRGSGLEATGLLGVLAQHQQHPKPDVVVAVVGVVVVASGGTGVPRFIDPGAAAQQAFGQCPDALYQGARVNTTSANSLSRSLSLDAHKN